MVAAAKRHGSSFTDEALVQLVRLALDEARAAARAGQVFARETVEQQTLKEILELERPRLRPVLNATGVIVHTNLGRAPVSAEAAEAMQHAAMSAVALEIEPETNERGGRMREISALLRALTGAEAALVVNNCASAVLLALSAVAAGKEVIVSRGEAIEIGGGFRIPDVLRQSGAHLIEVGTTNRTYAADYAEATSEATGAYLKVHPSNFRTLGFVHAPDTSELAAVAQERGVPLLEDLGSGALLDTARFGLAHEPTLTEAVAAGVDLILASGDKLLGGPQAGIIIGKHDWVKRAARHPLARAVRADKTCLAGIAATLRHYARGEAEHIVPVWRTIAERPEVLRQRAHTLADSLRASGIAVQVEATQATVGGGSLPGETLPSWALAASTGGSRQVDDIARSLRLGNPGVFGRIEENRLLFDLRTVLPEDDSRLGEALRWALSA